MTTTKQLESDGAAFTLGAKRDTLQVRRLADELLKLRERIAKGEALLKQLKEQERDLEFVKLPNAMTENGMKKLQLDNGMGIELEQVITGSIPEKRMAEAATWLRNNGHQQLLRNEIVLSFRPGEDEQAAKALFQIKKFKFPFETKISVHHMSLKSWAKEMIAKGSNLPLDLLGIFTGQRAKIKLPKED
jgi:hypothetical protein